MKLLNILVPAAVIGGVWAQSNSSSYSMEVTVTEYSYSDVCTSTGTITSTICDECMHTEVPSESGGPLTTYMTVYQEWCPTGLAEKTYTVTESCKSPGMPRPTDHVPQGFSVVTEKCPICESAMTAVLTTPVAKATSAPWATSTPTSGISPSAAPSAAPATTAGPSVPAESPAASEGMPSSAPAGPAPPAPGVHAPQGYIAPNGTAGMCETCGQSNSTLSPPIKAAKASYMSMNILVAAAAVFIAALFTAS